MLPNITANQVGFSETSLESCGSDQIEQVSFNGLSTEIIRDIASKLPLPDIIRLKQVCKHTNNSIRDYDINEAKKRCSIDFQHMDKVKFENPELYKQYMLLFEMNNSELIEKKNKIPEIKEISFQFVLTEFTFPHGNIRKHKSAGLNDALSIHIGKLENGKCFILTLNPYFTSRFVGFNQRHQMIGYAGDVMPTRYAGENNHSIYCGRSYEDAIKTFEQACKGSDLAKHIRELLGFQKTYY